MPQMDLGVIPLILKFDGNTAMYLDAHQEVNEKETFEVFHYLYYNNQHAASVGVETNISFISRVDNLRKLIGHREETRIPTFRGLALRQNESRNCRL